MSNFCKQCGLCCKLIPVTNGKMFRDGHCEPFEHLLPISYEEACRINNSFVKKVHSLYKDALFFTCKYLNSANECTCYETRPDICRNFPSSPLALINEDCGYCGEIFIKNEHLKQTIRRLKEEIISYEAMMTENPSKNKDFERIINSHKRFIKKYEEFGSYDW